MRCETHLRLFTKERTSFECKSNSKLSYRHKTNLQLPHQSMNEAETRAEHIDPALKAAGWCAVEGSRMTVIDSDLNFNKRDTFKPFAIGY